MQEVREAVQNRLNGSEKLDNHTYHTPYTLINPFTPKVSPFDE